MTTKQIKLYKEFKGQIQLVDRSLSSLIEHFVSQNNDKADDEARNLKR